MFKRNSNKEKNKKGQSLFEVVLAISLISLIMTSVVALSSNAVKNSNFSNNQNVATSKAQETFEWLRGIRDANWDIFHYLSDNDELVTTWCVPTLIFEEIIPGECNPIDKIPDTNFLREIHFSTETGSLDSVDVEVSVEWQDKEGYHTVSSNTTFVDWRLK